MRSIRIDDVIVARSDANEAEPLPDGLAKKVYNEPLVVRADNVLIDGLRRLKWHQAQGHETAPAVIVSTFLEAMDALAPQHEGRSPSPKRIWNFHSVLKDYALAWKGERARKGGNGWTRGADGKPIRAHTVQGRTLENSARHQYRRVFNINGHTFQCSVFMYRMAESGDVHARDLLERVESGELNVVRANRMYRRPGGLSGNVTNVTEQRRVLERGVAELQAQVTALQKLGYPVLVTTEEVTESLDGMVKARTDLTIMIIALRNILKERETNG